MTDLFGNYQSQSTIGLRRIDSSKYPDTNKDFEANVQRLNSFVDYISQYLQQMQKGVDEASKDPITKMRDMITNFGVLLGGGELLYGINLGDLQYYLPAIGAMFGFDSGQPFPLNLFYAAEHFLLGYIVPLDSFASVIEDLIDGWATALGLSPEFISSLHDLLDAIQGVTSDISGLLNSVLDMFGIFGVDGGDFGPFGDLWHAVSQLLGGFDLNTIGDLTDPVFNALAPWIHTVAQFINWLDSIIKSFSGGLTDVNGILNFASIFTSIFNFNPVGGGFDPAAALSSIATAIFSFLTALPFNLLSLVGFGTIGNTSNNLLANGDFLSPSSISDLAGIFTWDGDAGLTGGTPGAAKTIANGTVRSLFSNMFSVAPGQVLNPSVWTMWSGATGSGSPIQLQIAKYLDGVLIGSDIVASKPFTASSAWTQMTGNYTVPNGVDRIAVKLVVTNLLTAGSVWFTDGNIGQTGQIDQNWISGLVSQWTSLFGAFGGSGAGLSDLLNIWPNLLSMFGIGSPSALNTSPGAFNPASLLTSWIGALVNPLGLLAQLVGGQLMPGQEPQYLHDLVTSIGDAWSGFTTTLSPVTSVVTALQGIFGVGSAAQSSNIVQDAKINSILAGPSAISIFDTFSGPASTTLDSTNWDQVGSGSGTGTYGIDGNGNAVFNIAGFNPYNWQNKRKTALATNIQGVAVALNNDLVSAGTSAYSAIRIQIRMNNAMTDWVEAYIDWAGCKIGYVISNSFTILGSPLAFAGGYSTAGTWELDAGVIGNDRTFVLSHNGTEVLRETDSLNSSAMDASHRYPAFEATAGVGTFWWASSQYAPPPVGSFAASDRLATA
jgi:hypothetical protein